MSTKNKAAQELGALGGKSKSEAKAASAKGGRPKTRKVYFSLCEFNAYDHLGHNMMSDTPEGAEFYINVPETMLFRVSEDGYMWPYRGNMQFAPQTCFYKFSNISFFEECEFPQKKNTVTYKMHENTTSQNN